MIRHRTLDEARRFDLFKIVVLALLIVLALLLTIRARLSAQITPPTAVNAAASPVVVTVVVTAPSAPEPTAIQVQAMAAPTVAVNPPTVQFSLSNGPLVMAGSSLPDSVVQVVVDGAVASTARAGGDGAWSSAITLTPGQHDLSVRAVDAGGVLSESEIVTLIVAPTIISPAERAELPQGPLTLTGVGEPGTEIEVLDKGEVSGRAQVGADGGWSFTLTPTEGAHEFSARQAGNAVATSSIIHVVVGSPPPVAAATAAGAACTGGPGIQIGQSYLVGPCDTLTFISKRTGISLQALIAANPQIKNPDLILIGQTIRLP